MAASGFGPSGFANAPAAVGGSNANDLMEKIYEMYLRHGQAQEGLLITSLGSHLKNAFPGMHVPDQMEINRVVAKLCNEGRVYSTIDENHHTYT